MLYRLSYALEGAGRGDIGAPSGAVNLPARGSSPAPFGGRGGTGAVRGVRLRVEGVLPRLRHHEGWSLGYGPATLPASRESRQNRP